MFPIFSALADRTGPHVDWLSVVTVFAAVMQVSVPDVDGFGMLTVPSLILDPDLGLLSHAGV
jgi:hypothetical protein